MVIRSDRVFRLAIYAGVEGRGLESVEREAEVRRVNETCQLEMVLTSCTVGPGIGVPRMTP